MPHAELDPARLRAAKAHARQVLADVDGVQGVGIGDRRLRVYVRDTQVSERVPATIDDVAVECVTVGVITASEVDTDRAPPPRDDA